MVPAFHYRLILALSIAVAGSGTIAAAQTPQLSTAARVAWTLDDVVTTALSQHPAVESARAGVAAARGQQQTAGTRPNPVATYWLENTRFPGQSATSLETEASLYATLPIEPFLQRGSRLAQAGGVVRAAEAEVTTAGQRVAADAVHAFYRVALAQASLEAARDNRAAIGDVVDYVRNRVAEGATAEGELIRTEVERDRIDTDVTLAEVELIRAQSALRPFLGGAGAPADLRVVVPAWAGERATLAPLAEFTTRALAHRSELLANRAKVEAASGAIALEHSLAVRQLGATFGLKRTAGVNAMVAGLSVTLPLFDRNHGEIQRATSAKVMAEQQSRWLERVIAGEVEAEYRAAERLTARASALQPSFLNRAEESRRITLAAYREGAASLLQVLDASRALSEARLAYARTLVAVNESLFDLGIAAGDDPRSAARVGRGVTLPAQSKLDGGSR